MLCSLFMFFVILNSAYIKMANGNVLVYYQNVRGLRTKTSIFFRNLMMHDFEIICLSETWLLPGIYDTELFDNRYNIYRCDRNYELRGDGFGGGVLIAVNRSLTVRSSNSIVYSDGASEVVNVSIALDPSPSSRVIHVYCGYFPHGRMHEASLSSFFDDVSDLVIKCPFDAFVLFGDFNISSAKWCPNNNTLLNVTGSDLLTESLICFLNFNGLSQFNHVPNKNNKQLDLVMSNSSCIVTQCTSPLVPEDAYHPALEVKMQSIQISSMRSVPRIVRLFRQADYDNINKDLFMIDWCNLHKSTDINEAVDYFYEKINYIISCHVPVRMLKHNSRSPPWFSSALHKIIREKLKFHKKWKRYGRLSDFNTFCLLRERQKRVQRECYEKFIESAENNIKCSSRNFWYFVKSKKCSSDFPDNMFYGDKCLSSGDELCDVFNTYFQSAFELNDTNVDIQSDKVIDNPVSIGPLVITQQAVEKYLGALDINKGYGPDNIPPLFLRMCHKSLAYPVSVLFNISLISGLMPEIWKRSYVVPVFKSGDKHNICNYRPISKLSTIAKLFEKIIYDILYPFIRPTIINQQHGFVDRRSTETNLCELMHRVTTAMHEGHQVDVIYTDYSKAFDKISHPLLLSRLNEVGIHGDLLRWLQSYLRDRSQAVTIKGFCSSFVPVTSGVPQGSHLGPLLFNIFINKILMIFQSSEILLYADDMKIFRVIKSSTDCALLQDDLNRLCDYCKNNHLHLNIEKCCSITFSRKRSRVMHQYSLNGRPILKVDEIKDLGVYLDSGLLFNFHINYIKSKAYKMLGFIMRIGGDFRKYSTLRLLYNSFVRSILEYGSTVWNPQYKKHIVCIENLQSKFNKYINFKCKSELNDPVRGNVSLYNRRIERDMMFLFKLLHNEIDSPYLLSCIGFRCPRMGSRNRKLFNIPLAKTNYVANSVMYRLCNTFNENFPNIDIFDISRYKFKTEIRNKV
jgi:hypothetical protein